MAKKKSTKKDLELQIYEMHLRLNQINHYMTGIAEILNRYIDFGGKSKKFYDEVRKEIEKNEGKKDAKVREK